MILKPNANNIAMNRLKMDNVVSAYKSTCTAVNNNYKHPFAQNLQIYLTKIGLILSDCCQDISIEGHTFLSSIRFICLKVVKNPQLYKVMRALDINDNGNFVKHELKDINVDIKFTLIQYNELISQIIRTTGLDAFKVCYINFNHQKKSLNLRDVPLVEEQRHHKYFVVNGFQFQLKICPDYTVDQYTKKLTSKITIYWPNARKDAAVDVVIKNKKTKAIVASATKIDLSKDNSKKAFPLHCSEKDLDRRVLELEATITLYKKEEHYYTTGILFWKESHSYDYYNKIEERTEVISQFFRPQ